VNGRPDPAEVMAWLGKLGHDLRNQLAPIRTATQMLQLGGLDPVRQREMLDLQERQVLRMVRMLDDVAELGRLAGPVPVEAGEALDLGILVDTALGEVGRHLVAASLTLEQDVPERRLPLRGDRKRLVQALIRLLDNARRFTPAGGRVGVRIVVDGSVAAVHVSDTGAGIEPGRHAEIFALPRERRDAEGLGISLLLARACAVDHGGALEVTSAGTGQGSEFVLRLPLAG
jgi:signal transduction histidine kinase